MAKLQMPEELKPKWVGFREFKRTVSWYDSVQLEFEQSINRNLRRCKVGRIKIKRDPLMGWR